MLANEKENQLIEALRRGNPAAKRTIYEQYYRYLAAVCARYVRNDEDIKDLLQEVFIRIFTRIDRFENRGAGSLRAWCRRIAVNEALQHLRTAKRLSTSPLEETGDLPVPDETPDVADIPQQELLNMIRRLPDRYRTVLNLYIFEEMNHKEIAAQLGITESTSASDLHRAKALLTRWIQTYRKQAR